MSGPPGTAASAFAMPALFNGPGRATAGVIYAIVLASFAAVWFLLARDAQVEGGARRAMPLRQVRPPRPQPLAAGALYFVTFGGFVAMSIYLPKLLKDWFDYSLTDAGLRAAGFVIMAAVVARPIGGWLSDRLGGYRIATRRLPRSASTRSASPGRPRSTRRSSR